MRMFWRLFEIVSVIAAVALVFMGAKWLVYGISNDFGLGISLGFVLGFGVATAYAYVDRRRSSRELAP